MDEPTCCCCLWRAQARNSRAARSDACDPRIECSCCTVMYCRVLPPVPQVMRWSTLDASLRAVGLHCCVKTPLRVWTGAQGCHAPGACLTSHRKLHSELSLNAAAWQQQHGFWHTVLQDEECTDVEMSTQPGFQGMCLHVGACDMACGEVTHCCSMSTVFTATDTEPPQPTNHLTGWLAYQPTK